MWGFILEGESVIYNNCDEDDNNDDVDDDDDNNNDNDDDDDDDDLHDCCDINNWVLFSRVRSLVEIICLDTDKTACVNKDPILDILLFLEGPQIPNCNRI